MLTLTQPAQASAAQGGAQSGAPADVGAGRICLKQWSAATHTRKQQAVHREYQAAALEADVWAVQLGEAVWRVAQVACSSGAQRAAVLRKGSSHLD